MLLINVRVRVCELLLCSVLDLGLYLHWNITYVCVCVYVHVCVCVCAHAGVYVHNVYCFVGVDGCMMYVSVVVCLCLYAYPFLRHFLLLENLANKESESKKVILT